MFCQDYETLTCKSCRRNLLNMNFIKDWVSFRKKGKVLSYKTNTSFIHHQTMKNVKACTIHHAWLCGILQYKKLLILFSIIINDIYIGFKDTRSAQREREREREAERESKFNIHKVYIQKGPVSGKTVKYFPDMIY